MTVEIKPSVLWRIGLTPREVPCIGFVEVSRSHLRMVYFYVARLTASGKPIWWFSLGWELWVMHCELNYILNSAMWEISQSSINTKWSCNKNSGHGGSGWFLVGSTSGDCHTLMPGWYCTFSTWSFSDVTLWIPLADLGSVRKDNLKYNSCYCGFFVFQLLEWFVEPLKCIWCRSDIVGVFPLTLHLQLLAVGDGSLNNVEDCVFNFTVWIIVGI